MNASNSSHKYRRIVVKLGTSLLTGGKDCLDLEIMADLAGQVVRLREHGHEVIIVSSGAVASGRHKLGLTRKIKGIPLKQVFFAVGQSRLMSCWEQLFDRYGITVAQALLTKAAISDRVSYLNARSTLLALLELKVMCIVNENDVVAVDELTGVKFGDNDNLSAMVANLIDADLLLILSDIEGLYTADPHCVANACLIPEVEHIDAAIATFAAGSNSHLGVGGMSTKIEAARLATACGATVVIAKGREPDVINRVVAGEAIGTRFLPATSNLEGRQRWMLSGLSAKGGVVVDGGAATALRQKNGSLLAAGITQVKGEFERGDTINIYDSKGARLGYGITAYGSREVETIKGAHSGDIAGRLGYDYGAEVVHRNNMVLV